MKLACVFGPLPEVFQVGVEERERERGVSLAGIVVTKLIIEHEDMAFRKWVDALEAKPITYIWHWIRYNPRTYYLIFDL